MKPFYLKKEKVAYVDVDDSILIWDFKHVPHSFDEIVKITDGIRSFEFLPHKKNIEFVERLKLQGYGIVVWSAGGAAWAKKVVEALKLEDLPDAILSKPELAVDDLLEPSRIIKQVVWIDPITGEYRRNSK